jgi:hypothetical protein
MAEQDGKASPHDVYKRFLMEHLTYHRVYLSEFQVTEEAIMDHSNHTRLTSTELTPAILEGATVYGADDHKIGKVDHVHGAGAGSQAIVDVGGFLGIGAKPVAVPLTDLDFMRDEDGDVHAVTTWTKDQLKDMPEHRH